MSAMTGAARGVFRNSVRLSTPNRRSGTKFGLSDSGCVVGADLGGGEPARQPRDPRDSPAQSLNLCLERPARVLCRTTSKSDFCKPPIRQSQDDCFCIVPRSPWHIWEGAPKTWSKLALA